ncbi:MAG: hypothetical protein KatS3mg132_575 [Limisphaera sp.]|nr:MAG: hypothetical protein KatS3mg132_575 [Limisphaera sp.]
MKLVEVKRTLSLDDYASFAHLAHAVEDLRAEARMLVPRLQGRRGVDGEFHRARRGRGGNVAHAGAIVARIGPWR